MDGVRRGQFLLQLLFVLFMLLLCVKNYKNGKNLERFRVFEGWYHFCQSQDGEWK